MSTVPIGRSGNGEVYERTNWSPSHQLVAPASNCAECAATHAITTCCWSGVGASCSPNSLSNANPGDLHRRGAARCIAASGVTCPVLERCNPRKTHMRQAAKYLSARWVSQRRACLVRCVFTATDTSASPIPPACLGVTNIPA